MTSPLITTSRFFIASTSGKPRNWSALKKRAAIQSSGPVTKCGTMGRGFFWVRTASAICLKIGFIGREVNIAFINYNAIGGARLLEVMASGRRGGTIRQASRVSTADGSWAARR